MNRVGVGLDVPGNVAMPCEACNNHKRDHDQKLPLAENGWESFLSHDGTRCATTCETCAYWRRIWPEDPQEPENFKKSVREMQQRMREFQEKHAPR